MTDIQGDAKAQTQIVANLEIRFIDGTPALFRVDSAYGFFLCSAFLKYFLTSIVILAMIQFQIAVPGVTARGAGAHGDGWDQILVWILIGMTTLAWYVVTAQLAFWFIQRGIIRFIYAPFITFTGTVFALGAVHVMTGWFMAVPPVLLEELPPILVRNFVVITMFELQFSKYVVPLHPNVVVPFANQATAEPRPVGVPETEQVPALAPIEPDGPPDAPALLKDEVAVPAVDVSEAPEAAPQQPFIVIGRQHFNQADLVQIQIEDHFLNIETVNRRVMVRGSFKQVVPELDPELGLQASRSVWVARQSIQRVERLAGSKVTILMKSGNEIPVPRSRLKDVIRQLQTWDIAIHNSK